MPKFRKKPVVIEARQLTEHNHAAIADWCHGKHQGLLLENHLQFVQIETLEGEMSATVGDWVIKEPFPSGDRQFYPCKPDIFEASYEPVEGAPPGFEYLDIRIPVPVGRQWTHNTVAGLRLDAAAAVERVASEHRRTER